MGINHHYTQTVADGTATSVVRPSDWNSAHKMNYALGGNTVGSASVSGLDVAFHGGNNITLSADTANSRIIISGNNQSTQTQAAGNIAGVGTTFAGTNVSATMGLNSNGLALSLSAPAGGGGGGNVTVSNWIFPRFGFTGISSHTATAMNGSMFVCPENIHQGLTATKVAMLHSHTVVSSYNTLQNMSMTLSFALYSKANDTLLSLASSGSQSFSGSWSTSNGTGSINGMRELYVPININATPGDYFAARIMSITGDNASAATAHTISHFGAAIQSSAPAAAEGFGIATNASQAPFAPFMGRFTTTTNAFPSSIALSNFTLQTGTNAVYANFYREYKG